MTVPRKSVFLLLLPLLLLSCSRQGGELIEVQPGDGFNFPYFLFIPDSLGDAGARYLIVEPNNSGFAADDLGKHREKAKRTASRDFYLGNYVARKLGYPLLVPVFPRPETRWQVYTHALDRDVMLESGTPLERIDLQLIAMIDHASAELADRGIEIEDRVLMSGFSASGTFVNRFTALHPRKVKAVAAGGLNGVLIAPVREHGGRSLRYPVGVADLPRLTGGTVDKEGFRQTPQFYFMGALDENDAVPYQDAFAEDERNLIYSHFGERMLPDRWQAFKDLYRSEAVAATVVTYPNTGHEVPEAVKDDVVDFFAESVRLPELR